MNYLVFDHNGEMLDVLSFDSENDLTLFKVANPTYVVKKDDDFVDYTDDFFYDDEEEVDEC